MATNSLRPCFLLLPLLAACADDPRPQPDAPRPTATVTGVVEIDSAIQNATVFIDFDNDNQLDGYEPRVATDATGHFSLTWETDRPYSPHTIGAIVTATSTRVGVTDASAPIGFDLHMRAPLVDATGAYVTSAVISPFTTLVVSEMAADPTLTQAAAVTKLAGALTASQMPFTGPALDVMADYAADVTADTATSANSRQLRLIAGAIAAIVSASVAKGNAVQSFIDCNDAEFFDPSIVAMDKQLTTIANGTYRFTQLTATQQADVQENPGNYRGFFIDTTALSEEIENELLALALELAAELFDYFKEEFAMTLEEAVVDMVVDELFEVIF